MHESSNTGKPSVSHTERTSLGHAIDEASAYLSSHNVVAVTDAASLKKIRRKVDWHLYPLLASVYLIQVLDKFALNFAAIMGLPYDLHLAGNEFSDVATFFFVAYVCAEIPNVYFLQRFPASKWLASNIVLWGIATACTAAVQDYNTLLVARVLLGLFEATTGPSTMVIISQYYDMVEQAPRYAYWSFGNAASQSLGALISFACQHASNGASLSGWRIMFVVLGCVTVCIGFTVAIFIPDTPMQARFLDDIEKVSLLRHVKQNGSGIRGTKFRGSEVWEAIRDPQIWFFALGTISLSVSAGVIAVYSSTLIKNMGFDSKQAALLGIPSGFVSAAAVIITGLAIRRYGQRWLFISIAALIALLGACLMSFIPSGNNAGHLAGIWLINTVTATYPMMYHYIGVNVSGYTKRSLAGNVIASSFGIGALIGPQTFRAKDAPNYAPAKITLVATFAATAVCMVMLRVWYGFENRRRDQIRVARGGGGDSRGSTEAGQEVEDGGEVRIIRDASWKGLTDRKNSDWRYVY